MPQLIITPYSHIYLVATILLGISFFVFAKHLAPSTLHFVKIGNRSLIFGLKSNLLYIYIAGLAYTCANTYSICKNVVFHSVDLFFNQVIYCIHMGHLQHLYLCSYINNNVFSKISDNLLLNNNTYEVI